LKEHFDGFLNLRQLILDRKPELIVECGGGNGDLTKLIAHMQWLYDFELYCISDKKLDIPNVVWMTGISYQVLPTFEPESIDLCIIDTDHNYWTLRQELLAVAPRMKEGGLIVMHDVEEFYHNTGMGMSYWNGAHYPEDEIKAQARLGGTGLAMIDFLHDFRGSFKLTRYVPESFGAAVIEKKTVSETQIIMPGPGSVFAKPAESAVQGG